MQRNIMHKYLLSILLALVSAPTAMTGLFDYPEIQWGVGRQTIKNTETHRLLYET